ARLGAAPAADMKAQLTGERNQAALQGAENAGRDARGMPVHSHDGAEGLEPERIGQPAQIVITPIVMNDSLGDDRTEPRHTIPEPSRNFPAMQGKIGASCAFRQYRDL